VLRILFQIRHTRPVTTRRWLIRLRAIAGHQQLSQARITDRHVRPMRPYIVRRYVGTVRADARAIERFEGVGAEGDAGRGA